MKEYERLALKSASYRCTTSNENLDKFIAETHSFGFEMGFQKFREMFRDVLNTYPLEILQKDLVTYFRIKLETLGEKEV